RHSSRDAHAEAFRIASLARVRAALLLQCLVYADRGLTDLVEGAEVATDRRSDLVLEKDNRHVTDRDRGIEGLVRTVRELRQNDVRDGLRWQPLAVGEMQRGVILPTLRIEGLTALAATPSGRTVGIDRHLRAPEHGSAAVVVGKS